MEDGSENSLQDKLLEFAKKNWLVLALFSVGLMFLGIGVMQILGTNQTQIKFEKGAEVGGVKTQPIKVDVEGQVLKPGVYELPSDARVQDALIAAGGLGPEANRNAINLAAKVADGQKIYIPATGEAGGVLGSSRSSDDSGVDISGGLISVNSAGQAKLEELPGIGPVTAQKIIDARPYSSPDELVSKGAVGQKTFEKIKDLISL